MIKHDVVLSKEVLDMLNMNKVCIFNTFGHGGGTIKRRSTYALLLALAVAVCIFPSVGGTENPNTSEHAKIDLSGNKNVLEVNAGYKYKKVKKSYKYKKSYKKVKAKSKYKKYRKKVTYKKYKKVKAAYKYKKVKSSSVVQGNPVITSQKVSANAKCSCSLHTDYKVHTGTWVNYCPYCHKYGTLSYTNGQGCPEGMFYCDVHKGGCDADFCIIHGKAHTYSKSKYLTPA